MIYDMPDGLRLVRVREFYFGRRSLTLWHVWDGDAFLGATWIWHDGDPDPIAAPANDPLPLSEAA